MILHSFLLYCCTDREFNVFHSKTHLKFGKTHVSYINKNYFLAIFYFLVEEKDMILIICETINFQIILLFVIFYYSNNYKTLF